MPQNPREVRVVVADGKALNATAELGEQAVSHNGNGYSAMGDGVVTPENIVKRDGRVMPFEIDRIEDALARCFAAFDWTPATSVNELAHRVVNIVAAKSN